MFNWFKKKEEPKRKPQRIAVHCPGGVTVVHYSVYRTVHSDGRLTLHDGLGGGCVIADYPAGQWNSLTNGARKVSK
jgi:hypothetical protein